MPSPKNETQDDYDDELSEDDLVDDSEDGDADIKSVNPLVVVYVTLTDFGSGLKESLKNPGQPLIAPGTYMVHKFPAYNIYRP